MLTLDRTLLTLYEKETDIALGEFLCERTYGPQRFELLSLSGIRVEEARHKLEVTIADGQHC
jgi:hypothetical protein